MWTPEQQRRRAGRRRAGSPWAAVALAALLCGAGCSDSAEESAPGGANSGSANSSAANNAASNSGSPDELFEVPQCNWIDDPTSCEGWRCYRDARGQVCEQTRPDRPDGRAGWQCSDEVNPGYTTCWREDEPGGGNGGWTCRDDANGNQVCTQDDPGGYGDPSGGNGTRGDDQGGNGQWDCAYNSSNRLECTRTDGPNGGPGWRCWDDARGSHCEGTISDDPAGGGVGEVGGNDEPSGGGWVCVNDGDTRRCDNPHDDDTPGQAGDNPTGGPGWTCRQVAEARVCEYDDPTGDGTPGGTPGSGQDDPGGLGPRDPDGGGYDTPDGGGGWRCVIESGVKTCTNTDDPGGPGVNNGAGGDDPGGGGAQWDCRFDPDTGRTTCLSTPDTPSEDPGWMCYEEDERRVCVNDDPDGPGSGNNDGPGPGDDPDDPNPDTCGTPTGNVQGRVCTPSGDHWVVGATVTVSYTDCNGQPHTLLTQTDAEGYFILTGVPVGTHTVTVEKGPYRAQHQVVVTEGQTTTIPLGDFCFDQSTQIAVISGQYDQIGRVLDDLGFVYDGYDGYPENNGTRQLLGDLARMNEYDVIFMNCGSTIRGVFDDPATREAIRSNIEEYVASGGHIYMSDWEYGYAELAFTDKIDFSGDDNARFDVLSGAAGYRGASVTDAELEAVLGEDRVTLNFDYPAWAVVEGVSADVRVYLRGDVELLRGGIKRDVPVLMAFEHGEGSVIYTSYHIHQNDAINDIFTFTVLGFQ